MPDTMSAERRMVLKALGANIVLTDGKLGMKGSIEEAEKIKESDPDRYVLLQQFKNPANPVIHEKTTGPEIWDDTDGGVDAVVAGVGTGGTITGISRYLKHTRKKPVVSVAVEPEKSPVITQTRAGMDVIPGPHGIQGIGAGFIPDILDLGLIDRVETVSDNAAFEVSRRLAREEGILCGISSGAAVGAAMKLCREREFRGKTIVVILPDSGERYLSTDLYA